ncbi:MAG: hypothetical protein JSR77_01685 [Planctomycetes bacterium]|nr:hypothetical protein [Planctomycetota bacterium]
MDQKIYPKYESIRKAARVLGVPLAWLEREAKGDRIPSLRASGRVLVNIDEVTRVLAARTTLDGRAGPLPKANAAAEGGDQ